MSAIQIVKYNQQKREFELDLTALENILLDDKVHDANIAVISIAGAFRKGKSFMLGFFLRYLNEAFENGKSDWLGDENTELRGFSWKGGYRRHTTGIWVWSKVFTKTLPSGEKIGIMLMDTQGTFDSNSTMNDNVTIFSLSTMLSSIQIYNLFNNIQEDNLQHLQLFTEYGKLAREHSSEKAFQKLLFLVRDWSFPYEAPYGFNGGRQILDNVLLIKDDADEELKYVRTHLKSCYESIDCFLMPYPGRIATVSQHFSGQLKDIDVEFKDMLKELVPGLLSPENLQTKRVNGIKVTGQNFLSYVESYWSIFKDGGKVKAESIFTATVLANILSAKEEAFDYYDLQMEGVIAPDKPYVEPATLLATHQQTVKGAQDKFNAKAVLGAEQLRHQHLAKLNSDMENQYIKYMGRNEVKKTKDLEQIITNLSTQIDTFKSTVGAQSTQMTAIQQQMEQYRQASDAEKQRLQAEINRLQQVKQQQEQQRRRGRRRRCSVM